MFVLAMVAGPQPQRPVTPRVESRLTVIAPDGSGKKVVYAAKRHFEAPNWSPDGRWFVVNSGGRLYRIATSGGEPEMIDTGDVNRANNDHGISPDGKWLAISAGHIYLLPFGGGTPVQVTSQQPSYYHGWSPDGRTLAYCARRNDNFDIYAIPASPGPHQEQRLTMHAGYDDGPDYTPDGKWIYFNSDRSGSWDIWRIPATGAGSDDRLAERITRDEMEDWFPHPSPDGKWLVFVSFPAGTKGHPANQNVRLRIMPLKGGSIRAIDSFNGGQGTINVNSWAPDSKRFAYFTYRLLE